MEKRKVWILGLIVIALVLFGPGLINLMRLAWKRRVVEHRLRELEQVRQELTNEHQRLTTDPVYVEELIRSTFKVAKPGELVVPLEPEEANR